MFDERYEDWLVHILRNVLTREQKTALDNYKQSICRGSALPKHTRTDELTLKTAQRSDPFLLQLTTLAEKITLTVSVSIIAICRGNALPKDICQFL